MYLILVLFVSTVADVLSTQPGSRSILLTVMEKMLAPGLRDAHYELMKTLPRARHRG